MQHAFQSLYATSDVHKQIIYIYWISKITEDRDAFHSHLLKSSLQGLCEEVNKSDSLIFGEIFPGSFIYRKQELWVCLSTDPYMSAGYKFFGWN